LGRLKVEGGKLGLFFRDLNPGTHLNLSFIGDLGGKGFKGFGATEVIARFKFKKALPFWV